MNARLSLCATLCASMFLAACGGGGSDAPPVSSREGPSVPMPLHPTPDPLERPTSSTPIPEPINIAPNPAPLPIAQAPIRPTVVTPVAAPRPPSLPASPFEPAPVSEPANACEGVTYATPAEAQAAAPRDEFGRIIGAPPCLEQPAPTAPQSVIDIWNAICQTARCMVTPA